jgi:hypothetical protein
MAFPATDMRIKSGTFSLVAKCCHLYTALKPSHQGTFDFTTQLHKFAGVCTVNGRNRTGAAQVASPGRTEQPALFMVAAPIVIAIKVFTFRTSRSLHFASNEIPQDLSAGGFGYTRVRYSPVRVSTRMVSPTFTKFGHCTSKPVSTLTFLVTPVAVSPRTATSA